MNRLKELRKEKRYTQVKMQMLTGIDQSDYSKIESGRRYFTFEQCRKLALALDTSMDYLAGLTDERSLIRGKNSFHQKRTTRSGRPFSHFFLIAKVPKNTAANTSMMVGPVATPL